MGRSIREQNKKEKNKKAGIFWLLVVVFFHYNFVSIYDDESIKWNSILLLRRIQNLQFNPDRFPHATLKAFNEFIEQYEFPYKAQYPERPEHATEACITKWTATINKELTNKQTTNKQIIRSITLY